jgi:hypothetical protein
MRAAALSWTAAQLFGLSLVGHPGRSLRAPVLSTVGRVVAAEVDPIRYADRLAFCRGLGLGGQWLPRTGHAGVRGIGRGAMRDLDRICHRSVGGISQGAARLDAARRSHRRGACGNRAPARVTGGVGLGRAQTSSEKPRTRGQEHYFFRYRLATLRQLRHFPPRSPEPSQMLRLSQGPMIILRPLRTEVSQTSRVSQRHLLEQRSARLPRQIVPQRVLPALAGLAPFVELYPGFRPQAWAAIRAREVAFC